MTEQAEREGWDVLGGQDGFQGLLNGDFRPLNPVETLRYTRYGGTFLGSSRLPNFHTLVEQSAEIIKEHTITHLAVIGGNGSLRGAALLSRYAHTAGLPGTIDNDVNGSELSIGFDTALNTGLALLDGMRDSAESLPRLFALETLGGDTGDFSTTRGYLNIGSNYELMAENLLDLSHLGYVHTRTIGGNPKLHMNARLRTEGEGEVVRVIRHMPDSEPPPTYTASWPFRGRIDRWQEVVFRVSHLDIWTGGMDVGTGRLDDPGREGFHMRGFHGVTPETATSTHYFWTIATNPHPEREDVTKLVVAQTAATFEEDKVVIEAQWRNQQRFPGRPQLGIHVDAGPARARRVISGLLA